MSLKLWRRFMCKRESQRIEFTFGDSTSHERGRWNQVREALSKCTYVDRTKVITKDDNVTIHVVFSPKAADTTLAQSASWVQGVVRGTFDTFNRIRGKDGNGYSSFLHSTAENPFPRATPCDCGNIGCCNLEHVQ